MPDWGKMLLRQPCRCFGPPEQDVRRSLTPHCVQAQHTPHHHQVKVKVCSTNLSAILIYKSSDFSDVFFLDVVEMRIKKCLSITLQSLLMSSGHWDSRMMTSTQ